MKTDSEIDPADPWARPHQVGRLQAAFGADDVFALMPGYTEIPEEFRAPDDRTRWNRIQSRWFFDGLRDASELGRPKPGIDLGAALAHLRAIQCSFQPPHEHKSAGVAYLLSRWFDE